MILTLVLANIPRHQQAAALKYGKREGDLIIIDAADLFVPVSIENTSPEQERVKAKRGGCCDPPRE